MRGSLHPGSNVFLFLWVGACWAIPQLSIFTQRLHLLQPWKWKRHVLLFCVKNVSFATHTRVMPRENCDLSVGWKGGCCRTLINSSSCPHCPTCVTITHKRGDISVKILISTPWLQSVQPTNVAPLSRMCIWYNDYGYCYYLRNILESVIVKGRKGLNSNHHNTILCPFPLKPYVGFLYRIMFWVFVAVCGTPFVPCSFSLFYSCIMFL